MMMQCGRGFSIIENDFSLYRSPKALILVLGLLISGFSGIVSLPVASASLSGDVAVISGSTPIQGANYSHWDLIQPSVIVQNLGSTTTSSKPLKWTTCAGDFVTTLCSGGSDQKNGLKSIPTLSPGQNATIEFDTTFEYYSKPGIYTIVFRFLIDDQNASNDAFAYTFNLSEYFMDIEIDSDWDIRPGHHNYAIQDGEWIYNSDTEYPLYFKGIVTSCTTNCDLVVEAGWRLIDDGDNIIANDSVIISNPGGEGGPEFFNLSLPNLSSPLEGVFLLEYGVLNSSSDMNSFNNLASSYVYFDDTIDLIVEQMYPAYKPDSTDYFFGQDSVEVEVKNNGHTSIINTTIELEIFSIFFEYESGPYYCSNATIHPGRSIVCNYDLEGLGSKILRITIPTSFAEGDDDKPSDNVLSETVNIVAGEINPVATQDNTLRTYDTGQNITLRAQVASTAARPLNYSWYLAGVIPWSYGKSIEFDASLIGMGEHMFMVTVEDALGNTESSYTYLTVFNRTRLQQAPWLDGEAVTLTSARLEAMQSVPRVGVNYNLQSGLDALIVMNIEVISTDALNPDTGMENMYLEFNLSALIPPSINRSSLQLFNLHNFTGLDWGPLSDDDEFSIIDEETASALLVNSGAYLLAGSLPEIEVSPGTVGLEILPEGYMRVIWQPSGDLDNLYFGGWRIYRNSMPVSTNMPFPLVDSVESYATWELLVGDTSVAELGAHDDSWNDPTALAVGMCSSYFVVPIDRQSIPDFYRGNVSSISESGGFPQTTLTCGDAVPPNTEVVSLQHTVTFTNDSECWSWFFDWSRCYVVNLTWTWPADEIGGAVSYNLYRLDSRPNNTDLKLLQPLETNITFTAGTVGWYQQSGWIPEGPVPYRTYYYILTPTDEVGNVMYIQTYGESNNIERVQVDDQYWDYREYLVPEPPPPPEPPFGIEYLATFESYLENEIFQITGMTFLVLLCLNLIGLPLLRRRVKKFKRSIGGDQSDDDEYDDDFSDFFD